MLIIKFDLLFFSGIRNKYLTYILKYGIMLVENF